MKRGRGYPKSKSERLAIRAHIEACIAMSEFQFGGMPKGSGSPFSNKARRARARKSPLV